MTPAAQQIWVTSLAIGAVMLIAIVVLLTRILVAVKRIRAAVSAIWADGQAVVANTTHLPLLDTTNHLFDQVLEEIRNLAAAAATIDRRRPDR